MLGINKVYCVDVLEGLKQLDDGSVDCVITSPPYWALRDYGDSVATVWDGKEDYVVKMPYRLRVAITIFGMMVLMKGVITIISMVK